MVLMASIRADGATTPADNTTTSATAAATPVQDTATAADTYRQTGEAKIKANDFAGAVAVFNQWVEAEPKNAQAWQMRGRAKDDADDYPGAIADCDQALKLDPTDALAYYWRGQAKDDADDYAGAVTDLDHAVELDPKNADAWATRGSAKDDAGDYAGSIADINQSLELDPTNAKAYYLRGWTKNDAKDYAGAIADYSQTLKLDPTNVPAYAQRGGAKLKTGDYDGALDDFNQSLELDPTNVDARLMRGDIMLKMWNLAGAQAEFNRCLELPHDADQADSARKALAMIAAISSATNASDGVWMNFRNATINGQPAKIVLDTDSPEAVLMIAGAIRLGVNVGPTDGNLPFTSPDTTPNSTPKYQTVVPWFDKKVPLELSKVVRIGLSNQTITTQMPVGDFPGIECDGFMGWHEVRDNILVFDPRTRTVGGVSELPAETAGWLKLAVQANNTLVLETPLPDGKTGAIEVDTGSYGGVFLSPARWQEWTGAHPETTTADKIALGTLTLTNVSVSKELPRDSSADFIARLGVGALERMDMVVDAKGGFAYIMPLPPAGPSQSADQLSGGNGSAMGAESGRGWTVGDSVQVAGQELLFYSISLKQVMGDFDGAVADAEQAYKQYPQDPAAKEYLETTYLARGMDRLDNKKDYDGAIADFSEMIELDPKDTGQRIGQNDDAAKKIEPDSKQVAIGFVTSFSSKIATAYFYRGMAKMQKGNHDEANADFNQALAFEKDEAIYMMVGIARAQYGDIAGGLADLDLAQAADPKNTQIYLMRGPLKEELGDYAGALADLNHVQAMDPRNGQVLQLLGMVKYEQGDYAGAIASLNQLISQDPENIQAYIGRGLSRQCSEDVEGALTDYNRVLELDPQNGAAYGYRGVARQIQGNFTGALADYDQDIELNPDPDKTALISLYRQFLLARLGQLVGDLTKTMASWKSDWDKDLGKYILGDLGEKELLAAAAKGEAKEVPEQQCAADYFVGMTRLVKGDSAGARDAFQKVLATGLRSDFDYQLARAELARMDAAAASTAH